MAGESSTGSSHTGMAVTFGILTFVFAVTTGISTWLWNKERKKNIATNTNANNPANTNNPNPGTNPVATGPGAAPVNNTTPPKTKG